MKSPFNCAFCDSGNVVVVKNKKVEFELKNPGKIEVMTDCYECKNCGELYFNEEESDSISKQIDTVLKN